MIQNYFTLYTTGAHVVDKVVVSGNKTMIQCVPRKGFADIESTVFGTMYTLFIYPSVHK